jgi:hypothetical protein
MKLLPDWMQLRYGRAERRMTWLLLGLFLLSVPLIIFYDFNLFQWYVSVPVLCTYFVFVYLDHRTGYDPLLLTIPPK